MIRINRRTIRKICVIQLQPFGDVFLTTSYFKAIKEFFPNARLYYLMKEPYHKIVLNHPYIDVLIPIKNEKGLRYFLERLKIIKKLRNEKFDLVIDQQNMPSSQILSFASGAPFRLGYKSGRQNLDFLYNIQAEFGPPTYSASQKFDIVKPLGMQIKRYDMYLSIPEGTGEKIIQWMGHHHLDPFKTIVISPGSKPWKKWPNDAFAQVADLIHAKTRYKTVLLWGPGEEDDVSQIKDLMRSPVVIAPSTSFQEACALLKRSALLICNDSGINHSSVACGIKTLAIFGTTNPQFWSPANVFKSHRHIHNPNADKNDPYYGISPEQVTSEAMSFLGFS